MTKQKPVLWKLPSECAVIPQPQKPGVSFLRICPWCLSSHISWHPVTPRVQYKCSPYRYQGVDLSSYESAWNHDTAPWMVEPNRVRRDWDGICLNTPKTVELVCRDLVVQFAKPVEVSWIEEFSGYDKNCTESAVRLRKTEPEETLLHYLSDSQRIIPSTGIGREIKNMLIDKGVRREDKPSRSSS